MSKVRSRAGLFARQSVMIAALAVLSSTARAGQPEARDFVVTVDGKPAGNYRLAIDINSDNTETISSTADVKVKTLIGSYTYSLRSAEVWRDGRLVSVSATANDNGKKHAVSASLAGDTLNIVADGRSRSSRGNFLTTTGWQMPRPTDKDGLPHMLDTEDGTETAVRIQSLGSWQVNVAGNSIVTQRFHVTGKDIETEWWFDSERRPVRQEMKWDGHKVVLHLTAVRH